MITFTPLRYVSFAIEGKLNTLQIGPLPDSSGVITTTTNTVLVNTMLPGLGLPGKLPPSGPGGPGGGQYIEILTDDDPATGRITTHVPHVIGLQNGTHMLHFILSAGDGECVKDAGFAVSRVVHINSKTQSGWRDDGPMIIHNLPRAGHRVDDVTLDFALVNVALNPPAGILIGIRDYYVSVKIDGNEIERLSNANTHRINGLTSGTIYKIELALVDRATGKELSAVDHPFARTKPRQMVVF